MHAIYLTKHLYRNTSQWFVWIGRAGTTLALVVLFYSQNQTI